MDGFDDNSKLSNMSAQPSFEVVCSLSLSSYHQQTVPCDSGMFFE